MEHELSQAQSPFATEPVGRLIVKFAVPSVIALLVNSLYNIVDQIFIGNRCGIFGQRCHQHRISHHDHRSGSGHDDRQRRRRLSEP